MKHQILVASDESQFSYFINEATSGYSNLQHCSYAELFGIENKMPIIERFTFSVLSDSCDCLIINDVPPILDWESLYNAFSSGIVIERKLEHPKEPMEIPVIFCVCAIDVEVNRQVIRNLRSLQDRNSFSIRFDWYDLDLPF